MPVATELRVLPALELTFPVGLPGLKGVRRFRLEPLGDGTTLNPFGRLIALEPVALTDGSFAEAIRLIVAAPGLLWPDYTVEIDDATEALLEIDEARDATALVVVTLGDSIEASTANLFAPIIVNVRKRLATQMVPMMCLDEPGGWPIDARLPLLSPA
ncbi:MAG: flagellar assembly protein FliW [Acidimicrobiales bacterium]